MEASGGAYLCGHRWGTLKKTHPVQGVPFIVEVSGTYCSSMTSISLQSVSNETVFTLVSFFQKRKPLY